MRLFNLQKFACRSIKNTIPNPNFYQEFLIRSQTNFQFRQQKSHHVQVIVPNLQIDINLVTDLFETKKWQKKNIILQIDQSALISMRRRFYKEILKSVIYKDILQPQHALISTTPYQQHSLEELNFNQQIFFIMDSDIKLTKKLDKDSQEIPQLEEQIQKLYGQDQHRSRRRLITELNVNHKFVNILEVALGQQCMVYFSGLNQYLLRKILANYLSLQKLKELLYDCLLYSKEKSTLIDHFQMYCRQFIYLKYYNLIEPFEVYKLKNLRKNLPQSITFAHSYSLKSAANSQNIKIKLPEQSGSDIQRIQKNALLEVMLGNLWNRKFNINRFPYLTENYQKLNAEDQNTIQNMYENHFARYLQAKKKHYKQ